MRHFHPAAIALAAVFAISACDRPQVLGSTEAAGTVPVESKATADFASMNNLKGFTVGDGASAAALPTAYVLFDPQCPHCAHLWEAAKPLQSRVRLKWIPVGLLNGISTTQSAMLLEANDPVALMNANEATVTRTGRPLSTTEQVKAETLKSVEENTAMLRGLKVTSVPTLVYRDSETKALGIASGAMSTEKLVELLGLAPASPATAPAAN